MLVKMLCADTLYIGIPIIPIHIIFYTLNPKIAVGHSRMVLYIYFKRDILTDSFLPRRRIDRVRRRFEFLQTCIIIIL